MKMTDKRMKRVNNLLPQIADMDNLRLAFWKARKGKSYSQAVMRYRAHLHDHLLALRAQLLRGDIKVGEYRYFKIFDPKERQICASAFDEQVLHHALMNVCHAPFERVQIFDSYASRPLKGIHAAVHRAQDFTTDKTFFLKLDVKKFFDSIHHDVLKNQLNKLFKDTDLLQLFYKVIDSYEHTPKRGVPIGNLTSQYFANHYLSSLDHFIKETLNIKCYVRYMDDMILWHHQKAILLQSCKAIEHFLISKLSLLLKPFALNTCKEGLPFLGYRIFSHKILLSQRSKQRFHKKMRYLAQNEKYGIWDEKTCQRRVLPLLAFTQHAHTKAFRQSVLASYQDI